MFFGHIILGLIYTLFMSWLITQEPTNTKSYLLEQRVFRKITS